MSDPCFASWPQARQRLADWYETPLGLELTRQIHERLREVLTDLHGEHGLQIGAGARRDDSLVLANLGHRLHLREEAGDALAAAPERLPLASGSLNLLVLCHVIEYHDGPEMLIAEAERVLAPEGRLVVVVFNPWSLFGLRRLLPHDGVPWNGRFPSMLRLYWWCRRADLRVESVAGCWRRPPAHGACLRWGLGWLERGPRFFDHCGAVQVVRVRKRRIPATPVRLKEGWRRRLAALHPARQRPTPPGRAARGVSTGKQARVRRREGS